MISCPCQLFHSSYCTYALQTNAENGKSSSSSSCSSYICLFPLLCGVDVDRSGKAWVLWTDCHYINVLTLRDRQPFTLTLWEETGIHANSAGRRCKLCRERPRVNWHISRAPRRQGPHKTKDIVYTLTLEMSEERNYCYIIKRSVYHFSFLQDFGSRIHFYCCYSIQRAFVCPCPGAHCLIIHPQLEPRTFLM